MGKTVRKTVRKEKERVKEERKPPMPMKRKKKKRRKKSSLIKTESQSAKDQLKKRMSNSKSQTPMTSKLNETSSVDLISIIFKKIEFILNDIIYPSNFQ